MDISIRLVTLAEVVETQVHKNMCLNLIFALIKTSNISVTNSESLPLSECKEM